MRHAFQRLKPSLWLRSIRERNLEATPHSYRSYSSLTQLLLLTLHLNRHWNCPSMGMSLMKTASQSLHPYLRTTGEYSTTRTQNPKGQCSGHSFRLLNLNAFLFWWWSWYFTSQTLLIHFWLRGLPSWLNKIKTQQMISNMDWWLQQF